GLWHGARWTFVAWGLYHGVLLALHKIWIERIRPPRAPAEESSVYRALAVATTFVLVTIGWVFFRADSFGTAWTILARLAHPSLGGSLAHARADLADPIARRVIRLLSALAVVHVIGVNRAGLRNYMRLPVVARGAVWAGFAGAVYLFGTSTGEFIYFYL